MKVVKRIAIFVLALLLIFITVSSAFVLMQVAYVKEHPISIVATEKTSYATVIYDKDGNVVQKLGNNMAKANYSEDIPQIVKEAIVSIEDKRFYEHDGVDIPRTVSAIFKYIITFGHSDYGGSSITQQLVKNITGEKDRNSTRKIREWIYAIDIERSYDKDYILTQYLNVIYFAKGIYGIKDAARYYFDKDVNNLSINEAAFLAGIVQRPETYIRNEELANKRKNVVLRCMFEQGYISQDEYLENKDIDIVIKPKSSKMQVQSYFVDSVIDALADVLSEKYSITKDEALSSIYGGGYQIYTTLDPNVQKAVDDVYRNIEGVQSSIVILSNDGKVVAISGGVGNKTANMVLNRATSSRRQPGSALKPLAVYAPALENKIISKNSIVCDQSVTYGNWSPKNAYSGFKGDMTVGKAIEISSNTVAVQILDELGVSKSLKYLSSMNFELDDNDNNLSIALGGLTYGVTTLEMASGYQTLANRGVYCEPIFFVQVLNRDGEEVYNYKNEQEVKRVFSKKTAADMTELLQQVVYGSQGTARNFRINNFTVSAKTGTTNNKKDRWLCGYTEYYTVATWYGHDTPKEVTYTSSQIQQNTKQIFEKIHANKSAKNYDDNLTDEETDEYPDEEELTGDSGEGVVNTDGIGPTEAPNVSGNESLQEETEGHPNESGENADSEIPQNIPPERDTEVISTISIDETVLTE